MFDYVPKIKKLCERMKKISGGMILVTASGMTPENLKLNISMLKTHDQWNTAYDRLVDEDNESEIEENYKAALALVDKQEAAFIEIAQTIKK